MQKFWATVFSIREGIIQLHFYEKHIEEFDYLVLIKKIYCREVPIAFDSEKPTTVFPHTHTDPVCEFFSKNYLMAKLLQNNSNLNDLEYSRHLKVRKIEKKAKNFFEGQTKARGPKTQIFIILWTF